MVFPLNSGMCIVAFARRRSQLLKLLSPDTPHTQTLTRSRYLRLMALALTDLLLTTPFAIFGMYVRAAHGLEPWISWSDTHSNFSRVAQYPAILWRDTKGLTDEEEKMRIMGVVALELSRWSPVLCAFVFFGFFGFASEARRSYKLAFAKVRGWVGFSSIRTIESERPVSIG
jgi:pheromone a factor receptor